MGYFEKGLEKDKVVSASRVLLKCCLVIPKDSTSTNHIYAHSHLPEFLKVVFVAHLRCLANDVQFCLIVLYFEKLHVNTACRENLPFVFTPNTLYQQLLPEGNELQVNFTFTFNMRGNLSFMVQAHIYFEMTTKKMRNCLFCLWDIYLHLRRKRTD